MLFQQGYLVCLKRKDTIQSHAIWTIETNYTKNQHLCRKEMAFFCFVSACLCGIKYGYINSAVTGGI